MDEAQVNARRTWQIAVSNGAGQCGWRVRVSNREPYPGPVHDRVKSRAAIGLVAGDDYVIRPFGLEEVMLWLRAILRRTAGLEPDPWQPRLRLDVDAHRAHRAGVKFIRVRQNSACSSI
ncbi:hypothetical protein APR09_006575 [Nocardia amikacinitolerans]|nr:hypothetical protein [Nocardia amikacinitolerans]